MVHTLQQGMLGMLLVQDILLQDNAGVGMEGIRQFYMAYCMYLYMVGIEAQMI
jgi:hypothetical protein